MVGIQITVFAIVFYSACSRSVSAFSGKISPHRDLGSKLHIRFKSGEPGSDLFPSDSSRGYVPSGLTREQYEGIKKKERERESKMNYGSWGPRFNKSDGPPVGDWMVLPSLWTKGFTSNPSSQKVTGNIIGDESNTATKTKKCIIYVLALGYIALDVAMAMTYALHRCRESSMFLIAVHKMKRLTFSISAAALFGNIVMKLIALAITTKPLHILLPKSRK